jgi:hypothetical protein
MSAESVALDHYRERSGLTSAISRLVAQIWQRIDPANLDASWARHAPRLLVGVTGAQLAAARTADDYADAELTEQDVDASSPLRVNANALAGIASDGRPLDSLLYSAVTTVKAALASGATLERAMAGGLANLDMIARTQVADAGRAADGVAITARPQVTGYVRMLVGKSCSRCVILAGRRYEWNRGFSRHPRCDCIHVPAAESLDSVVTNPRTYFDSLTEAEQDLAFTKAGAQAIRDGADLARVVNARRGMYEAGGNLLTTEAITERGTGRRVRLMPEQIYREAGDDRDEAIRLLRAHGYLTTRRTRSPAPQPAPPAAPTFAERIASATTGAKVLREVPAGLGFAARRSRGDVPLSRPQRNALREYESSFYYAINGQLRRGEVTSVVRRVVEHLDAAMTVSPLRSDVRVWRGITSPERLFGDRLSGDLTGFTWREDAYTSTTADEKVARDFQYEGDGAKAVRMRILAPAGTRALRISEWGFGQQAEILLARGLNFRVVADRGIDPDGVRHIDVEVLDA